MGERLEREIEQIIREKGDLPRPSARTRRAAARQARRPSARPGRGFSLSSGQWLLASVGLLLVAALLWNTARSIGYSLVFLAAFIFLIGLAAAFGGAPGSSRYEKRWRGQPLDYNSGPPLKDRIQRWWRRRR